MYYIGIDLGGTNIAVGIVNGQGKIVAKTSTPTNAHRSEAEVISHIAQTVKSLVEDQNISMDEIQSVGIGTPGSVDPVEGVVHSACNLPFENTPLAQRLSNLLQTPVFVENDANCAALAEAKVGAGKGHRDVAMITLGTGVGGGIVIDGKLYGGFNHFGGEFGHMIIEHGGEPCPCGQKGCFEAYASATALARDARRAADANPASLLWKCSEREGKFSGRTAFDAAKLGDRDGQAVVDRYIQYLAIGIANAIHILQPKVVVIGGGVSHEGEGLFGPLSKKVDEIAYSYSVPQEKKAILSAAALGNDAGIIGAALLYERNEA